MPWYTWLGLALFGASVLAASAIAFVHVSRLSKASGSLQSKVDPLSARLTASTEELNRRSGALGSDQEHAKRSVERLRGSILQVQILVAALEEIRVALKVMKMIRTARAPR